MANTSGTRKDDTRTGTPGTTGGTGGMGGPGMTGAGATGGGTAGGFTDKARDMASSAMESARDTATAVADRAKDVASNVADTARDWASTAGHKAGDALGAVRDSAAGQYVADAVESGTRYFQETDFRGMADDLTNLIRRNPIPALLIGIGIGFLLARSTSRS